MVKPNMIFYNFKDFYKKAEVIKNEYDKLSIEEKGIYKLYVYSNRLIRENLCDKIWEYLNEPFGTEYYLSHAMLSIYL